MSSPQADRSEPVQIIPIRMNRARRWPVFWPLFAVIAGLVAGLRW